MVGTELLPFPLPLVVREVFEALEDVADFLLFALALGVDLARAPCLYWMASKPGTGQMMLSEEGSGKGVNRKDESPPS